MHSLILITIKIISNKLLFISKSIFVLSSLYHFCIFIFHKTYNFDNFIEYKYIASIISVSHIQQSNEYQIWDPLRMNEYPKL
jgi:hypothetical protein